MYRVAWKAVWTCRSILSFRATRRHVSGSTEHCHLCRLTGAEDGVALLTLSRDAARNALGAQLRKELGDALAALRVDPFVRVLVLHSEVPGVFCAGDDLKERIRMSVRESAQATYDLRRLFLDLEQLPLPTIAVIEGAALGAGLGLSLACDFRVAGAKALLGYPETALATIPGAGGTQRLPRLIGVSKAKELIYTSRRIGADAAEKIGLVDCAVEEGAALDRALELAREILSNGPVGVRMAKEAISTGMDVDLVTGMAIERAFYAQVIPTKDRMEGLTAFREKRKPVYKG